jgi:hypothetical protein
MLRFFRDHPSPARDPKAVNSECPR